MTGKVATNVNDQVVESHISNVVDYLKNKYEKSLTDGNKEVKKREDLEALSVDQKKVFFTLKGEGRFRWPAQPWVEWREVS